MYFVFNPVLYYIVNKQNIENFIELETNGEHISSIPYRQLKELVERFINENGHGVDENYKEKYIIYICDKLSC